MSYNVAHVYSRNISRRQPVLIFPRPRRRCIWILYHWVILVVRDSQCGITFCSNHSFLILIIPMSVSFFEEDQFVGEKILNEPIHKHSPFNGISTNQSLTPFLLLASITSIHILLLLFPPFLLRGCNEWTFVERSPFSSSWQLSSWSIWCQFRFTWLGGGLLFLLLLFLGFIKS